MKNQELINNRYFIMVGLIASVLMLIVSVVTIIVSIKSGFIIFMCFGISSTLFFGICSFINLKHYTKIINT